MDTVRTVTVPYCEDWQPTITYRELPPVQRWPNGWWSGADLEMLLEELGARIVSWDITDHGVPVATSVDGIRQSRLSVHLLCTILVWITCEGVRHVN